MHNVKGFIIMKYKIIEHETGCDKCVEATNLDEATDLALAWLWGGEWGEEEDYVSMTITDENGETTEVECIVGGPTEPVCHEDGEHDWESPYEIVGGLKENPGVWAFGGGQLKFDEVCCNCGRFRQTITESLNGQWPRTPERVTYSEPDKASLAWAGRSNVDEDE